MIVPVSYLQTDPRWSNNNYSTAGEQTTIGKSGGGPTCMAMVIASLKDKSITPANTAAWSLANGYKARNQGTYYSYFKPQGAAFDIKVAQVNASNIYGNRAHPAHDKPLEAIKSGDWVICCMGKGNWTSSGHYILWYGMDGDKALINDPNSTAASRIRAKLSLLQSQVKYYWVVTIPANMKGDKDMTMSQEEFNQLFHNMIVQLREQPPQEWSEEDRQWAESMGLITGNENGEKQYRDYVTREQLTVFMHRLFSLFKG